MKRVGVILLAVGFLLAGLTIGQSDKAKEVEHRVKTVYGPDGRPINQMQDAKGFHRVQASAKLSGGVDTISLNTGTGDGRQDVSFISQTTFSGMAWSLTTTNGKQYRIIPISGCRFVIVSSDSTDTATVMYRVEGE